MPVLHKDKLENKIESFIFNNLTKSEYSVYSIESNKLLTWNRLDLAFRIMFLDLKNTNYQLAKDIYYEVIRVQTGDKFIEYGNNKKEFDHFLLEFENTLTNIIKNGYDDSISIVPLADDGSVINGAHRTAIAIYLGLRVSCIKTEQKLMLCDYSYFYKWNVRPDLLELAVNNFIQYANNVYIAFLWPSGTSNFSKSYALFKNVIYKKKISFTPKGAFNLLVELYKHMDWVGGYDNNFKGAQKKLIECFPCFTDALVVFFQANSLLEVQDIKDKVRNINNIGYSSIHITDTKEEAKRISKILLNKNGLNFFNYGSPHSKSNQIKINYLQELSIKSGLKQEFVVDGGTVLSMYGIRDSDDFDLILSELMLTSELAVDIHNDQLAYHGLPLSEILYNPDNFFEYMGIKFVSLKQIHDMKVVRNTPKDRADVAKIKIYLESGGLKDKIELFKQSFFYLNIKALNKIFDNGLTLLRFLGLYKMVRWIYRKLKR